MMTHGFIKVILNELLIILIAPIVDQAMSRGGSFLMGKTYGNGRCGLVADGVPVGGNTDPLGGYAVVDQVALQNLSAMATSGKTFFAVASRKSGADVGLKVWMLLQVIGQKIEFLVVGHIFLSVVAEVEDDSMERYVLAGSLVAIASEGQFVVVVAPHRGGCGSWCFGNLFLQGGVFGDGCQQRGSGKCLAVVASCLGVGGEEDATFIVGKGNVAFVESAVDFSSDIDGLAPVVPSCSGPYGDIDVAIAEPAMSVADEEEIATIVADDGAAFTVGAVDCGTQTDGFSPACAVARNEVEVGRKCCVAMEKGARGLDVFTSLTI